MEIITDYVNSRATGETEEYTISSWTALSDSSPYTYSTTVTADYTIGANTIVELINDQAVLFANYGFAISSVDTTNNTLTIYALDAPASSVTLKINYKEGA